MASVVEICNLALGNIGKDDIANIDEASPEAKACKKFYSITVETMIQAYPWRWAKSTAALAEVSVNTKENKWLHAYQRPNNCMKVIQVVDESLADYMPSGDGIVAGGHAYEIEGQTIYCDLSPAYLVFTSKVTDPTLFPPAFVDAVAAALAARLAMPITRDLKIRNDAVALARSTMNSAQEFDANEVRETHDHPSDRIEARGPQYSERRITSG